MSTNLHFWLYLAEFVLQWEMFQTKPKPAYDIQ